MIEEHDLKATVSRGNIKPVYLLVGNDPYLTKHYAKKITLKQRFLYRLNFHGLEPGTAVTDLQTPPKLDRSVSAVTITIDIDTLSGLTAVLDFKGLADVFLAEIIDCHSASERSNNVFG